MSPEFLLQMNFQLQTRLDKIRQQAPLRSPQFGTPMEALPPIGCVTKDDSFPREGDFSDPDPAIESEPDEKPNGKPHLNGNGHANGTFRNENPRGVKTEPLSINDLQPPKRNDRSV